MPRKTKLKPGVADGRETEGPSFPQHVPLDLEERNRLNQIFRDPVFRKAWTNAKLSRPSCLMAPDLLESDKGPQAALNRISQMQGWEFFAAALFRQGMDPKPPRPPPLKEFAEPDPFITSEKPEPPKT